MRQRELVNRIIQERNAVADGSGGQVSSIHHEFIGSKIAYYFHNDGQATEITVETMSEFIDTMLPQVKEEDDGNK